MNQRLGKKSRSRVEILSQGVVCIYCGMPADSLEHMPPRGMFRAKDRPSGMEYPSCNACNKGTSGADAVASFIARIDRHGSLGDWNVNEAIKLRPILDEVAPGFLDELFATDKATDSYVPNTAGVLIRQAVVKADGPLTQAYLDVFSAKLGMALYFEHTGTRLPDDGGIETYWYLNAGLTQKTAEAWVRMMPGVDRLRQGKKTSRGQFDYRYNSDNKSIVAALAGFHTGLHVAFIATSDPNTYGFPTKMPHSAFTQPGQLMGRMPAVIPSRLIGLPLLSRPGATTPFRIAARSK